MWRLVLLWLTTVLSIVVLWAAIGRRGEDDKEWNNPLNVQRKAECDNERKEIVSDESAQIDATKHVRLEEESVDDAQLEKMMGAKATESTPKMKRATKLDLPRTIAEAMSLINEGLVEEYRQKKIPIPTFDILIPTYMGHIGFLPLLLQSVEWFWPASMLEKVVVVLDEGSDDALEDMVRAELLRFPPEKRKLLFFSPMPRPPSLPDARRKEWAPLTAWWEAAVYMTEEATSADRIMIMDTDGPLVWPALPEYIFYQEDNHSNTTNTNNNRNRKRRVNEELILLGRRCDAHPCIRWRKTSYVLGESKSYLGHGDFMRQLPFPMTRKVLKEFSRFVQDTHKDGGKDWKEIWRNKLWDLVSDLSKGDVAHLDWWGNYIMSHQSDGFKIIYESSDDPPYPRLSWHAGYMFGRPEKSKLTDDTYTGIMRGMVLSACIHLPEELHPKACKNESLKAGVIEKQIKRAYAWYDCKHGEKFDDTQKFCWSNPKLVLSEAQRVIALSKARAAKGYLKRNSLL